MDQNSRRSQRRPPDEEDLNRSLGPDNRCCFCLTLQTGSIIIAICNFISGLIQFIWYCTQHLTVSGFNLWAEENTISGLDITYLLLFVSARLCDVFLIVAAMKQKTDWDKTPLLVLPWLIINALELCLKVVFIMMLLFYGSQHIKMSTADYTSTLAFIGILTGAHIFCFLIIYQFRKNLVDERNIRRNIINGGRIISTNNPQQTGFAPSAPYGPDPTTDPLLPSGYGNTNRLDPSVDKVDSNHGRMSPPPSYDEVVFNVSHIEETKKGHRDLLSASGRDHNVGANGPNHDKPNTTSNSSSSSGKREERRSSSSDRKLTSMSSSNEIGRKPRGHNIHSYHDADEADRNHAPPQYSDAVRLPNIIDSQHCTPSTPIASSSPTEESGVL